MSLAALNGSPVSRASVSVPGRGCWWAGVDTTEALVLEKGERVTLTIGGLTLLGAVASGGVSDARGSYRIVGGAGKWGQEVKRKPYRDDAGVKVATLFVDLVRDVGEIAGPSPAAAARRGPHYARPEEAAYIVLNELAPDGWHVDFAGVTTLGLRPATAYAGDAPRMPIDPRANVVELATDDLTGLVPGVVVDGNTPASDVEYELNETRLTARVYHAAKMGERNELWRELVAGLFPALRFGGLWEYRVVTQTGDRLNLQVVRTATGMPDLARVPVRGVSGIKAKHKPGSLVLVVFADNDPSRPYVVAQEAPGAPGWMPLELQLGDGLGRQIARIGDTAGPYVITTGSLRVKAGD